jgi:serine/threonine protein kinase
VIKQTISHYRIDAKLGEGGMGAVYRAEDLNLGREVALKFLPVEMAADPQAGKRLLKEAQAASRLNHPYSATIPLQAETRWPTAQHALQSRP